MKDRCRSNILWAASTMRFFFRGYATIEVLQEQFERAMSNIVDFMDAKPLKLLNPEALSD
jgi:hypothetical protein